ncbi:MAG: hypothetical protein GWP06_04005 [Actinobacteria bacterium]|nr:hypothetical protein [Actinomycetota bacterium]
MKSILLAIVISVVLLFAKAGAAHANPINFLITDFGAIADGSTLATQAIQSAIDSCFKSGGGYVIVPSGRFLTGTIVLKNHVYLKLSPGAVLLGSKNLSDYNPPFLIYAENAHDFGIIGHGTIDGQGDFFWRGKQRPYHRPERTVNFENCRDVTIRDINIRNSAAFNIAFEDCDRVTITGVSIINDLAAPNTDGIDPISSSNVFISNCYIETGDDAICPKSHNVKNPLENLVVTNCVLISDDSAIKFGTASRGVIRNCSFSNIIIRNTKYGIGFYMKDGGSFEDIQFSNISVETVVRDSGRPERGTNSYAIFMDIEKRNENSGFGTIRNIMFSDMTINTTDGNCLFAGMPEQKIENLTLDNIRMRVRRRTDLSGRHKPRGTRKLKNIAVNDYAHISSDFTFAYIDGLNIRNLYIQDDTPDNQFERYAIWAKDVDNVVINGFQQKQTVSNVGLPVFKFSNTGDVTIRACKPESPNTVFLELAGERTRDIFLLGNDFTKVGSDIKLSDNAHRGAVEKVGNRRK